MMRRLINNESGSAIAIIAVALMGLLGVSALVADAGLLYTTRTKLVNVTDSAALAGAQELPYYIDEAVVKAIEYGSANDLPAENISVELINDNKAIKVTAHKDVKLLFARFLGYNNKPVSSSSTAEAAPISGADGVVPLGILEYDFNFGQEYTLKVGAGDSVEGWYGALALGGPGASTYEENLTSGYPEIIRVGDIINLQTGNISNPTKRAIDQRIDECTHSPRCSPESFHRGCSRLIKVPVINLEEDKKVRVVGFSMFLVDEVIGQGVDNYIKGKFIKTVITGEINSGLSDYGLRGVKLTH